MIDNLMACEIPGMLLLIMNVKWSDLIFPVLPNPTHLFATAAMPHPPELPVTLAFRSNNPPYQQFSRLCCILFESLILAKLPFHFQLPSRLPQYSRILRFSLWASRGKKARVTPLMLLISHLFFSFLSFTPQPELVEA